MILATQFQNALLQDHIVEASLLARPLGRLVVAPTPVPVAVVLLVIGNELALLTLAVGRRRCSRRRAGRIDVAVADLRWKHVAVDLLVRRWTVHRTPVALDGSRTFVKHQRLLVVHHMKLLLLVLLFFVLLLLLLQLVVVVVVVVVLLLLMAGTVRTSVIFLITLQSGRSDFGNHALSGW